MKRLSRGILLIVLVIAVERFCHWQTGGFRVGKIAPAFNAKSQRHKDAKEIGGSFEYLGSGAQFYAFASGDVVLKLFKTHHGMIASQSEKQRRLNRLFKSARLAAGELKNETGILAVHLKSTENVWGKVLLKDRLNIAHTIDLDKTAFVLQKRAEPAASRLSEQLAKGDVEGAKKSIEAMLNLAELTSDKGIKNKDVKLTRNCGFVGSAAQIIDFGSISERKKSSPDARVKVRKKGREQLKRWFHTNYPQYEDIL